MEKIVSILMERDGLTRQEAVALYNLTKRDISEHPSEAEEILMDYIGLEMDYIFEFIN